MVNRVASNQLTLHKRCRSWKRKSLVWSSREWSRCSRRSWQTAGNIIFFFVLNSLSVLYSVIGGMKTLYTLAYTTPNKDSVHNSIRNHKKNSERNSNGDRKKKIEYDHGTKQKDTETKHHMIMTVWWLIKIIYLHIWNAQQMHYILLYQYFCCFFKRDDAILSKFFTFCHKLISLCLFN